MMPGPIRPSDVDGLHTASIPEAVFEVFNRLIAKAWVGQRAVVTQSEAADAIAAALEIPRAEVFERHLLDIEDAYRKAGWYVEYDKPGYNETYAAKFIFEESRR
jgi:hypothetical protein